MSFEKIYLAGADHSWLHDISVTDDNVVLMSQNHFYGKRNSSVDAVLKENIGTKKLYTILYHMYVAFKSYFVLKAYSEHLGKKVINITPHSFIDAFDRMDV